VKAVLSTTVSTIFEKSLLPAFEAGTQQMFAQISAAFESGMQSLAARNDAIQRNSSKEISSLLAQVIY
jgi:hypothetical protein